MDYQNEQQLKDLRTLEAAWLSAKKEEDRAKESRMAIESLILEAIGYSDATADDFKNWKDDDGGVKITFTRKEEYDQEILKTMFKPEKMFDETFPFRVKLEPDAKKMMAFKMAYADFYKEKLAPICKIKINKPTFAITTKE